MLPQELLAAATANIVKSGTAVVIGGRASSTAAATVAASTAVAVVVVAATATLSRRSCSAVVAVNTRNSCQAAAALPSVGTVARFRTVAALHSTAVEPGSLAFERRLHAATVSQVVLGWSGSVLRVSLVRFAVPPWRGNRG